GDALVGVAVLDLVPDPALALAVLGRFLGVLAGVLGCVLLRGAAGRGQLGLGGQQDLAVQLEVALVEARVQLLDVRDVAAVAELGDGDLLERVAVLDPVPGAGRLGGAARGLGLAGVAALVGTLVAVLLAGLVGRLVGILGGRLRQLDLVEDV